MGIVANFSNIHFFVLFQELLILVTLLKYVITFHTSEKCILLNTFNNVNYIA